jgi:hypothetical protein
VTIVYLVSRKSGYSRIGYMNEEPYTGENEDDDRYNFILENFVVPSLSEELSERRIYRYSAKKALISPREDDLIPVT